MAGILSRYGFGRKIDSADDLAVFRGIGKSYRDTINRHLKAIKKDAVIEIALQAASGDPVYAEINHSRWIANCDHCGGAEAVTPGGNFFCLTCFNIGNKNRSRPVIFPENADEIEKELVKRILPANRNWKPGETLESLQAEKLVSEGKK